MAMSEPLANSPSTLKAAVLDQLDSLRRAGLTHLPLVDQPANLGWDAPEEAALPPRESPPAESPKPPRTDRSSSPQSAPPPVSAAKPEARPRPSAPREPQPKLFEEPAVDLTPVAPAERPAVLAALQQCVAECVRCEHLARTRRQTVFGVGPPTPRLCFLGEAPGADEDRQGEPFVGDAGQLLNRMITAMGLRREDVFILNVLKCRPPNNRTPNDTEIAQCRGYYRRQLAILDPKFICCLGAVAAKDLLETRTGITLLRGQWHQYGNARVMCTYHPSYLLRKPEFKRDAWEDLQMIMEAMNLSPAT